ncbi:MAG: AAA family ATPase, partial [Candidatus Eisenbacteria bacterium]
MLQELHIENFVLVERLRVRFGPGLNVLTGETGAGKTVLLEAVALLVGGRSDRPAVREGADEAVLQGFFDLSGSVGFPFGDWLDEGGGLLLERRIPRTGRGRAEANGRILTLEKLRRLGAALVDFHGQQERESLLDPSLQRAYLDLYAKTDREREGFRAAFVALGGARDARRRAEERLRAAGEREEYLRWQAREIDEAELRPGEAKDLAATVEVLKGAERLREMIHLVREDLHDGEGSAVDRIGGAADRLDRFHAPGAETGSAAEACRRALAEIEEALLAVRRLEGRIDAAPGAIDEAIARLERIRSLERKHRKSVAEIL